MNPNTAPTLATYLDRLGRRPGRSRTAAIPPPTPSLEDVLGAIRSRARAELADDAGEIDRGFITGVHKWETAGLAERLAEMSEPMRESMIRIMAIADDPQRSWQLDLSPAFQAYIERCEDDHNQESGGHVRSPHPKTNETARFAPKPDKPRALNALLQSGARVPTFTLLVTGFGIGATNVRIASPML